MAEMKFKISWSLAMAILLVVVVALVPVIIYILDFKEIFIYIMSAIIGWTVLVLIALMGAFFLGLAVGHRVTSKSDFTPFEREMLRMREEVKNIKKLLHRHNIHLSRMEPGKSPASKGEGTDGPEKGSSSDKEEMKEQEPRMEIDTGAGSEMKPLGNVRCSNCKEIIPLYSEDRPLEIQCKNCGKKGVLK